LSYSNDNGYSAATIETIMTAIMTEINTQFGTSYTYESFVGTNFYKYFYALAQRVQENEVKTSEIFTHLQQYFAITNESIQRPVGTSPGVIEALEREGYIAAVKPMIDADAGKIHICVDVEDGVHDSGNVTITSYANLVSGTDDSVTIGSTVFTAQAGAATPGTATFQAATSNDATATSLAAQINAHAVASLLVTASALANVVTLAAVQGGVTGIALTYTNNDANVGLTVSGATLSGGDADYADTRLDIATIIKDSISAGVVSQGTEIQNIVLSNGQAFDFKYNLPNLISCDLKLTLTLSENNQNVILSPEEIKTLLMTNIAAKYRVGKNFEPQTYFSVEDAPWCSAVLLEYDIGSGFVSTIYDADYDDKFDILLENVTLVEV
jgi:hypothetical protein